MKEFLTPAFRRFLITGGIAAGVNVGSRILYDKFVSFEVAVVLAYLSGMITAYLLARRYVFTETQRTHVSSSLRFTAVNALAIAQTYLVSLGLRDYLLPQLGWTFHPDLVAHLAGVATPVFTSFAAHSRWTFAK